MPRSIPISPENLEWLRANHRHTTQREMAERLGMCVDTLKRVLMREGLQEFSGAKYCVATSRRVETWSRPCLDCGDDRPRPRAYYYCLDCRQKRGFEET